MQLITAIQTWWPVLVAFVERGIALTAIAHAVLTKRDARAATGWVGLVLLAPILGSLTYVCFGINRLRRKGVRIQGAIDLAVQQVRQARPATDAHPQSPCHKFPHLAPLAELTGRLTQRPLLYGNQIEALIDGQHAFPAMLESIHGARTSVALESYIFDNDRAGAEFIDALLAAQQRGVEVRVLVDDVGSRYTHPSALKVMHRRGLIVAAFLPTRVPRFIRYGNLRNHRKLLIVDGGTSFTGGMNIREGCRLDWKPKHPVQDVHFRLQGPVSLQLQEAFAADWHFATDEVLGGETWFPQVPEQGSVWARGIPDGPDDDFEKLRMTLLGAIGVSQTSVTIVTPYFLPDESTVAALNVAAMRGVDVRIVLPSRSNIPIVQWASQAILPQVLERGCRIYLSPTPFDHTKLLLVDDAWSLVGSTNWDPRSLRLNFEFNVECYSAELNFQLASLVRGKIARSRELTYEQVVNRSLPLRLRDGFARLATPYL